MLNLKLTYHKLLKNCISGTVMKPIWPFKDQLRKHLKKLTSTMRFKTVLVSPTQAQTILIALTIIKRRRLVVQLTVIDCKSP